MSCICIDQMTNLKIFILFLVSSFSTGMLAQNTDHKILIGDPGTYKKPSTPSESTYRYIPTQSPVYIKQKTAEFNAEMKVISTQKQAYQTVKDSKTATVEQQVKANIDCVFSSPQAFKDEEKFGCAMAIEYAFANDLLTPLYEQTVIKNITSHLVLSGGDDAADYKSTWAGVVLGLLSNYYPPENYVAPISYTTTDANYPLWRSKTARATITNVFKTCLLNDDCPMKTKEGIGAGWGHTGSSAVKDIEEVLAGLNVKAKAEEVKFEDIINEGISVVMQVGTYGLYQPGATFYANNRAGTASLYLFKALGFIYKKDNDDAAKDILLKYMKHSGINNNYAYTGQYSFTLGIYAAFAGQYYGIRESEPYIESIATWHADNVQGSGAIPIETSNEAWNMIPAYIRKAKNIQQPEIGTTEGIISGSATVLTGVRNGLAAFVIFDLTGGAAVSFIYGSEAAMGCSFLAADAGYIIAAEVGGELAIPSYEFTLMLEQQMFAEAFSKTIAGKITNTIMKPIDYMLEKFGGAISKLRSLKFKNVIRYNPAVTEEFEDITLGTGVSNGSGSTFPINDNYITPSTSSTNITTHNIYVNPAATTSKVSSNTYVVTAEDFAKFAKSPIPIKAEDVSSIVETMAPKQVNTYMNVLKPASNTVANLTETTTYNANGLVSTISPAQISGAAGTVINGIRITSSIINSDDVIKINRVYYQDDKGLNRIMNVEFGDGTKVPVSDPDEADKINKAIDEYNLFCGDKAA